MRRCFRHFGISLSLAVMAGLDPAIHDFTALKEDVDARVKPEHDEGRGKCEKSKKCRGRGNL
jgi:hypothetical protein